MVILVIPQLSVEPLSKSEAFTVTFPAASNCAVTDWQIATGAIVSGTTVIVIE